MEPAIIPMLTYENGVFAMEWLCRVFGFSEKTKWVDDRGRLTHGEIILGEGMIMMASGNEDYQSPLHHRQTCGHAEKWSRVSFIINGVLVHVQNVRAHFEYAVANGAKILSGLESGGPGMRYRAEDVEGQRWMFMQKGD